VDDACPDHSADIANNWSDDGRVKLLRHSTNKGVGGAVKTGYCQAVRDGMDVVVKIDGDDASFGFIF
jgi:glycosyltransferase involved in cell wall biosynthesis